MSDVLLKVKVIPNSSREQVVGWLGDVLKVKLQAPPEDGKANKALKQLLAKCLGVKQKNIIIEYGASSPEKLVRIVEISLETLKKTLEEREL